MLEATKGAQRAARLSALGHKMGLITDFPRIALLIAATFAAAVFVNTLVPFTLPATAGARQAAAGPRLSEFGSEHWGELYIKADIAHLLAKYHGATVVDVRDAESFARKHIAGAVHIPQHVALVNPGRQRIAEMAARAPVVFYCSGHCGTAQHAVEQLRQKKIENVFAMWKGIEAWEKAGLPTETGPDPSTAHQE